VTTPKKPRKLPPRGKGGKFVKSGELVKSGEPEIVEAPTYSPHRIGIGEPIDWQRELTREVLPPQRRRKPKSERESNKLAWGVILAGAIGVGYAFSRLPSKGRHL
jgi:hypothetical protein